MLSLPSSLIFSILLLTTPSLSAPAPAPVADDGMWHPAGQAQASTWAPTATTPTAGAGVPYSQMTVTAKDGVTSSKVTTPVVAPTALTSAAAGDWQTAVTWPAGCELWANPCPSGAHVIGGATVTGAISGTATGTASYENGFTSYTTMTDANGVITGMPPKATLAAGVTAKVSNSTTLSTITSSSGSSSTGTAFTQPTTTRIAASSNGAASLSASLVLGALALTAALL